MTVRQDETLDKNKAAHVGKEETSQANITQGIVAPTATAVVVIKYLP